MDTLYGDNLTNNTRIDSYNIIKQVFKDEQGFRQEQMNLKEKVNFSIIHVDDFHIDKYINPTFISLSDETELQQRQQEFQGFVNKILERLTPHFTITSQDRENFCNENPTIIEIYQIAHPQISLKTYVQPSVGHNAKFQYVDSLLYSLTHEDLYKNSNFDLIYINIPDKMKDYVQLGLTMYLVMQQYRCIVNNSTNVKINRNKSIKLIFNNKDTKDKFNDYYFKYLEPNFDMYTDLDLLFTQLYTDININGNTNNNKHIIQLLSNNFKLDKTGEISKIIRNKDKCSSFLNQLIIEYNLRNNL